MTGQPWEGADIPARLRSMTGALRITLGKQEHMAEGGVATRIEPLKSRSCSEIGQWKINFCYILEMLQIKIQICVKLDGAN